MPSLRPNPVQPIIIAGAGNAPPFRALGHEDVIKDHEARGERFIAGTLLITPFPILLNHIEP